MLSAVPAMLIAGLLLKPGLITRGMFITMLVIEVVIAALVSEYSGND